MINQNETRALWISIAAAIFAVFLVYSYTQEKSAQILSSHGKERTVIVAAVDIPEMQTLDESMIQVKEVPAQFTQPSALSHAEDAVGLVALAPIKKGEQILSNKIIEPSPATGLSLQITPGKRALTIPIDEMRGIAKLVKPGDRIDLIASVDLGGGMQSRRQIKTLMQNVPILATGLKIVNELPRLYEKSGKNDYIKNIRDDTSFSSITIEATPEEAQNLIYILATSPSSLFMTLRHPSDQQNKFKIGSSDVRSVLGQVRTDGLEEQPREPTSVLPSSLIQTAPQASGPTQPLTGKPSENTGPKRSKPQFRDL